MSKLKRLLGVLSIVSLFVFSSCVDDTVSPEVTALRQAQVDLLNANTAVEEAKAAFENARVEMQNIQNAFDQANNAIRLAAAQAAVDATLSNLAVTLAQNQTLLKAEELALATAVNNLAYYAENAGLDRASALIAAWQKVYFTGGTATFDGTSVVVGQSITSLRSTISELSTKIARWEAVGKADGATQRASFVKAEREAAVAKAKADLATLEARLASYNAVLTANDASFKAVEDLIKKLALDVATIDADIAKKQAAVAKTESEYAQLQQLIDNFEKKSSTMTSTTGATAAVPGTAGTSAVGATAIALLTSADIEDLNSITVRASAGGTILFQILDTDVLDPNTTEAAHLDAIISIINLSSAVSAAKSTVAGFEAITFTAKSGTAAMQNSWVLELNGNYIIVKNFGGAADAVAGTPGTPANPGTTTTTTIPGVPAGQQYAAFSQMQAWFDAGKALDAAKKAKSDAEKTVTSSEATIASWTAYATAAKTAHDKAFAAFQPGIGEYRTAFSRDAFGQQIVAASVPNFTDAQLTSLTANNTAFLNAVKAEITFKNKGLDKTNGNISATVTSAADTTTFLATRALWDGIPKGLLFPGANVPNEGRAIDGALDLVEWSVANQAFEIKAGKSEFSEFVNALVTVGGTLGQVKTAFTSTAATSSDATLNNAILMAQYADISSKLGVLAANIDSISKGTDKTTIGKDDATGGGLDLVAGGTTSTAQPTSGSAFINQVVGDLNATLKGLASATGNKTKLPKTSPAGATSALAAAKTAVTNADKNIVTEQGKLDAAAKLVAPYLTAYTAAKKEITKLDSVLVTPRFELYTLANNKAAVQRNIDVEKANMEALQLGYKSCAGVAGGTVAQGTCAGTRQTIVDAIDVLNGTGAGSIAAAKSGVETAETALILNDNTDAGFAAEIADAKAELALRQTELTVLEALAAKIQALVLAAIG